MSRSKCSMIVILLVVALARPGATQTLGVYFDTSGTMPNLGDSTMSYPVSVDLYVIARDYSSIDGLSGWEAAFSWTSGLYVTETEIIGQSVNVGTFPEFKLGLASPIGVGNNSVVLARFTVLALNAGDIFIGPSSIPSIPGSTLPACVIGESLWPMTLAYGGNGMPSASIGRSMPLAPSGAYMELNSRFGGLEYRQGEMYASEVGDKSWTALPATRAFQLGQLTEEQFNQISLMPRQRDGIAKRANKGAVLYSEDFEIYTANFDIPFAPTFGCTTSHYGPAGDTNPRSLWGVTDSESASGARSAYCGAIDEQCVVTGDTTECTTQYSTSRSYLPGFQNELLIPLSAGAQLKRQLSFRVRSDIREDIDRMVVFVRTEDAAGALADYPIAGLQFNQDWGAVSVPIPDGLPASAALGFCFVSGNDDNIAVAHEGLYLDDIVIESFDNDLRILSVSASRSEEFATPNVVDLKIANDGSMETGDFALAFAPGATAAPGTSAINVGVQSMLPNTTRQISVQIPYNFMGCGSPEAWTGAVLLSLDSGHVIPEHDEANNFASATVSWGIDQATPQESGDRCRAAADAFAALYGWPAPSDPWDVDVRSDGTVFVTDPVANRIAKYNLKGRQIGGWAHPGTGIGEFLEPRDVAVADNGRVAVLENQTSHRVLLFDEFGGYIHEINESNGLLSPSQSTLLAIAMDHAGILYVAERPYNSNQAGFFNRILRFDSMTGAPLGVFAQCSTYSPGVAGQWLECEDIAFAQDGRVYLLDAQFHYNKVLGFSPSGIGDSIWGQEGTLPGQFNVPQSMAVSQTGNVFITDIGRIHEFTPDGVLVQQVDAGAARTPYGIDFFESGSEFCVVANWQGSLVPGNFTVYGPKPLALGILGSSRLDANFGLRCSELQVLGACQDSTEQMDGVTADGVSSLLLRVDLPVPGTVQFSMTDSAYGETSGLGELSELCGAPAPSALTVESEQVCERGIAFAVYFGPEEFDRSDVSADYDQAMRDLTIEYGFYPEQPGIESLYKSDLEIHRPPVVFVHGLWDRPSGWGDYRKSDWQPGWRKHFVDYRWTHGSEIAHNSRLTLDDIHRVVSSANGRSRIATAQIDLVAHSMGGDLARTAYTYSDYRSRWNSGQGYFNKVLFANVPHMGSPLAKIVTAVGSRLASPYNAERVTALTLLSVLATMRRTTLDQIYGAAAYNLSPGSPALNFAEMTLPIHEHIGVGGSDLLASAGAASVSGVDPYAGFEYMVRRTSTIPEASDFDGLQHDFVVSLDSQLGDIQGASAVTTSHDWNGTHLVAKNPGATSPLVIQFLHTASSSAEFFAPTIPASNSQALATTDNSKAIGGVLPPFGGELVGLELNPGSATPGSVVACSVHPTSDVGIVEAYVVHEGGVAVLTGPSFTGAFDVPPGALGNYPVRCLALMADGTLARAADGAVAVNLGGAYVESLQVSPTIAVLSGPGAVLGLQVMGHFSDGIDRDIAEVEDLARYLVADENIARVDGVGVIRALSTGTTLVTVRVHEPGHFQVDVTLEVIVGDATAPNNPPHASAGGPYTFCAGNALCLDGSESYDYDTELGDVLNCSWDLDGDGVFGDAAGLTPCVARDSAWDADVVALRVTDSHGMTSVDYAEIRPESPGCYSAITDCAADGSEGPLGGFGTFVDVVPAAAGGFSALYRAGIYPVESAIYRFDGNCDLLSAVTPAYVPAAIGADAAGVIYYLHDAGVGQQELIRYSSAGNLLSALSLTGLGEMELYPEIEFDAAGGIYIMCADWEAPPSNAKDVFIARLTSSGAVAELINLDLWLGNEKAQRFCVGASGNIYVYTEDGRLAFVRNDGSQRTLGTIWAVEGSGIGQFEYASDLAFAPNGDLLVAGDGSILRYTSSGQYVGQRTGTVVDGDYFAFYAVAIAVDGAEGITVANGTQALRLRFDNRVSAVPDDPDADAVEVTGSEVLVLLPGGRDSRYGAQTIRFVAGRPLSRCALRIFDVRGRLVREMSAESVEVGLHEWIWDARDRSGAPVGSGVYLLLLEADGHRATGRTLLLR